MSEVISIIGGRRKVIWDPSKKIGSKRAVIQAERTAQPTEIVKKVLMHVAGVKFRRLKGDINKISRKKRELLPEDRNIINRWWNNNQALITEIDKDSPICAAIAKQCNDAGYDSKALCPAAVAGRISSMARLGMMTAARRGKIIARQLKHRMYTVVPEFTKPLLDAIQVHYTAEIADAKLRQEQHALLKRGVKVVPNFKRMPVDDQGRVVVTTVKNGKTTTRKFENFQVQYSAGKKIASTVESAS